MKIELAKTEVIHFVGIGGIGMSGLALIMKIILKIDYLILRKIFFNILMKQTLQ